MARPMLDELELQQVQTIEVDGDQVWTQHGIPALEGDFFQGLGRRASQVTLTGVLTGAEVADNLKKLRDKFRAAAPVSFVADIASATRLDQVLIEEMGVREVGGRPSRFEYAFTLREFIPATPTEIIIPPPPPPPPPPKVEESTLEVEVIVEGDENFDHANTRVLVRGTDEKGQSIPERELPNDPSTRQDRVWTVKPFPAGTITATATTASPVMTGSATVVLPLGQTQRAVIILRPGQKIATGFMIHYWFDKAFVEPCMRHVLSQVATFAGQNREQKLIIVGHTDESGSDEYNQSLSERRARGAHAYLTFGRDQASGDAAVAEWNELRKPQSGGGATVRDAWGARQYQHMLQDLGFYNGQINGIHNPLTDQAVRDFQAANGLPVDGDVGDQTWPALIRAYMAQDNLAVPKDQFMPNVNAAEGCDNGFVRWLGCGEKMSVESTPQGCDDPAWRPNRRTELLFVRADNFPCKIPEPVTFKLAPAGGTGWCLGPGNVKERCCFITRNANEKDKFLVQTAEPGTFIVNGRIQFEDGTPLANTEYTLIAPDGEFMNGEITCHHPNLRKGLPVHGRTDADGNFTESPGVVGYPSKPKGVGVYTLEIHADVAAREEGQPLTAAKGPVVCKRLDGSSPFIVVVVARGSISCQLLSRVHFEFSKSFIRPSGKRALRKIAEVMQNAPPGLRLLPVGHTDLVGGDAFNDGLGERRAKAAFGFLTGNPPDPDSPGRSIWLNLHRDAREGWGANELEHMLQDLGFYCHHVTGVLDAETNRAIRVFKNNAGLGDNSVVDDPFLNALFAAYIAHDGAAVPANRFLSPINRLSCSEEHPIDLRGGNPFGGRSELNRRVEFVTFPSPPDPAPTSRTDCAPYVNWRTPCEPRWLDFVGPKRNPADPADSEEFLAFLEVANWQNAFDFDPPDASGHIHPTGDQPRADFIDRDPDRFFVQITDMDRQGAGTIRAQIRTVDENDVQVNPSVEFELQENPDRPGIFRSHDVANGRPNPMLLVADEIDNGEINNGSAAGATPFRPRGIANGALNDPLHRAVIGGQIIINYQGSELGRISVCDPECIRTIPVNIVILRLADGTAITTEADVGERVNRLQQAYMQCGIRFDVTIRTAAVADMPAGVILSAASGISVNPGQLVDRTSLDPEERALIESPLNIRTGAGGGRTDTLQIFYANRIDGAAATAIAYPRVTYTSAAPGDDIFNLIVIGADDPEENSTLPHEMMHILLNDFHNASSSTRTNLFFEAALGQRNFVDTTVTSNKRIPEEQCERIMSNVSGLIPELPGGVP